MLSAKDELLAITKDRIMDAKNHSYAALGERVKVRIDARPICLLIASSTFLSRLIVNPEQRTKD